MFSEFSHLIEHLKNTDPAFAQLFEQHHFLDEKIHNKEYHVELGTHEEIENLKKEKLRLKDHIYAALRKASAQGA